MPPSYRRAHGWAAVEEHAGIVARRGDAPVHMEVWRVRRGTVVVIVSDDRAGGLAMRRADHAERPRPEVTFADDDEDAILLVEARDRPGLLAAITSALSESSARIVDSEIVTVDGRVRDRFQLTEADGTPLSGARRLAMAQSVLAAVERGGS